jgi:hypothetical protein
MQYIAGPEDIHQRTQMNLIQAGAGVLGLGLMSPLARYTAWPILKGVAKAGIGTAKGAWWLSKTLGGGVGGQIAAEEMGEGILGLAGRVGYNVLAGGVRAGTAIAQMGVGAAGIGVGLGKTFLAHPAISSIGVLGAAATLGTAAGFVDRGEPYYGAGASNMTDIMGGTTRSIMNNMNATGDIVLGAHRGR